MKADRRIFLKHSLAATALLATQARLPAVEEKMIPVIDTHQHLWDIKKFKLNWIKGESPLGRTFSLQDYAEATEGLNVVKSVYMEVDVAEEQQLAEAEYVTAICQGGKTTMAAAVVSGRPASPDFAKYLDHFKGNKFIKGIRQVLHGESTPSGFCNGPAFVKGVQLLGERGLRYDLCIRGTDLEQTNRLVRACPGTRLILDHCGNPDLKNKDHTQWKKGMAEIAKNKNLVVKVSGFIASTTRGAWKVDDLAPIINHTLDSFGPDRVMFGGDWPVCTLAATYKEWLTALRQVVASRPLEEQKKLFHDNAASFYGL
ncbi:MAG: amidohydrolase [Gemmataceae bacterium]|nr:amidohydrolase [Gemmataceae bacterium]